MKTTAKNRSINLTRKLIGAATVAAFLASSGHTLAEEFVIPLGDLGGRPLIDVYIGDNGPYTMIFDTGAPSVILNQDIGKSLGLEVVGEQRVGSPGGQGMQAVLYEGQTITIGDYSFEVDEIMGMDFSILMGGPRRASEAPKEGQPVRRVMGGPQPAGETPTEGQPVRRVMGGPGPGGKTPAGGPGPMRMAAPPPGVLGFWTLDEGVVGINFVINELTIDPDGELVLGDPGVVDLNMDDENSYPWFEITAAGIPVEAHIDTGAPGTFTFGFEWKDKLPLKAEATIVGEARLADGPREIWGAQLDGDIEIGGMIFHDPKIGFLDGPSGVNVGSGLLQTGGFRIDRENDLIELNINPAE